MIGKEIDPEYWFNQESFQQLCTEKSGGPTAVRTPARSTASDPMAFAVHSEYINHPAVFLIDPEGVIRFAYRGTDGATALQSPSSLKW